MTRFSLFYNFDAAPDADIHQIYRDVEEQIIRADALGFDGVWIAEHHFASFGRSPAPLQFLARVSALAPNLRLGTAIAEAPHYHPLRLAEEAALLDRLSNGRLELGLGTGGQSKASSEYEVFGAKFEDRNAVTRDAARTLIAAFREETSSVRGELFTFDDVRVLPRPVRTAEESVWLAASNSLVDFAGEHQLGLLFGRAVTAEKRAEYLQRYETSLAGNPGRRASLVFAFAAETDEAAQHLTLPVVKHYAKLQAAHLSEGPASTWDGVPGTEAYFDVLNKLTFVVGSVRTVTERLDKFRYENQADELLLQPYAGGSDHRTSLAAIELLATEVIPNLKVAVAL